MAHSKWHAPTISVLSVASNTHGGGNAGNHETAHSAIYDGHKDAHTVNHGNIDSGATGTFDHFGVDNHIAVQYASAS